MSEVSDIHQIALLGTALAIGLLIGVERGWASREAEDGQRIAGLRTYGLTGLLGGGAGLISQYIGATTFGFLFVGFAISIAVAIVFAKQRQARTDISITGLVTMLLTFVLGALATLEHPALAASAAVGATMLLQFKGVLHRWLQKLEEREMHAALQLLVISVVLLPILPDHGYGPLDAINPYEIWWMVVLIAGISFIGYFLVKIAGTKKGVILTALAAGMASSTALTLHFSRLSTQKKTLKSTLASGILLACGTMFPRIVLISTIINPDMFNLLIIPMGVMTLVVLFLAAVIWRQRADQAPDDLVQLINPLELKSAIYFGALLVVVVILVKAANSYFGDLGLYILAGLSGIADVDAINLSLSRMSTVDLSPDVAALAIVIASCSNTLLKAMMALFIGCKGLGTRVLPPLVLTTAAGLITIYLSL